MNFIIDSTFVVNRTGGVATSLLVTLKAYDLHTVPDKTVTLELESGDEDIVVPDYDSATVLGTRSFSYNILADQQTDKVGGESGYVEKVQAWMDTYTAGQDYITCLSHIKSEVL